MPSLPTHIAGIPLWAILFGVALLILFFLKISADSTNQDRYPTTKLFVYIATILIAVVGIVDFIRWADLW
jgi:cytochrome c oxidase assembly factor CtaG